jgi:hypothetical protein
VRERLEAYRICFVDWLSQICLDNNEWMDRVIRQAARCESWGPSVHLYSTVMVYLSSLFATLCG